MARRRTPSRLPADWILVEVGVQVSPAVACRLGWTATGHVLAVPKGSRHARGDIVVFPMSMVLDRWAVSVTGGAVRSNAIVRGDHAEVVGQEPVRGLRRRA